MGTQRRELDWLAEQRGKYGAQAVLSDMVASGKLDKVRIDRLLAKYSADKLFQAILAQLERRATRPRRAGYTGADKLASSIKQMAKSRKFPPELLMAIMQQESSFNPLARSEAGAVGLMQLMPDAAKQSGLTISKDKDERQEPMRNIQGGLDYLAWLRDTYKLRTVDDLLGAYNAGPGRLKDRQYQGIKETTEYIGKVKALMAGYKKDPKSMAKDLRKLHSSVKALEGIE